MTGYINWKAFTQANVNGSVLPTQGNNVADYETVLATASSAVAPEGAMYASIYCDVASKVEANVIYDPLGRTIFNAKEVFIPAGGTEEIMNIIAGKTTLTVENV